MDPSLGGQYVFGTCCHSVHIPNASQVQIDNFFGVTGNTSTWGGGRGRVFEIMGILVAPDVPTLMATEAALLSMDDGVLRTYVDTQGRTWPNCLFHSEYQPSPNGPIACNLGWCLPFRCLLRSLT